MNIQRTPEIVTPQGDKLVLWNFSLNKYPKALHSLVSAELQTAHSLVEQYTREASQTKRLELFQAITFYHSYLSATYLARRNEAKKIGMSLEDMRSSDTQRKRSLKDANAFARSLEAESDELSSDSEVPEMPSSSAAIARELDVRSALFSKQQSERAKKNLGKRKTRKD